MPGSGGRAYNVGMITATEVTITPELQAAMQRNPLELASQLADALAVLDHCRMRNMNPGDEFLDFVESLLSEMDMMQVFGRVYAA